MSSAFIKSVVLGQSDCLAYCYAPSFIRAAEIHLDVDTIEQIATARDKVSGLIKSITYDETATWTTNCAHSIWISSAMSSRALASLSVAAFPRFRAAPAARQCLHRFGPLRGCLPSWRRTLVGIIDCTLLSQCRIDYGKHKLCSVLQIRVLWLCNSRPCRTAPWVWRHHNARNFGRSL